MGSCSWTVPYIVVVVSVKCVFIMCVAIHIVSYVLDENESDEHSVTQASQQKVF